MAVYAATKHAIEGYSESVDHEVREYGVRVLLVEPAYTKTGFDANAVQPDAPLPIYAAQRQVFDRVLASAMEGGDEPTTVAKAIVAAATDPKPKLRYTAGSTARRVSALRRFVPAGRSTGRSGSSIACPPESRPSLAPTRRQKCSHMTAAGEPEGMILYSSHDILWSLQMALPVSMHPAPWCARSEEGGHDEQRSGVSPYAEKQAGAPDG